jgi:hypothetical protein
MNPASPRGEEAKLEDRDKEMSKAIREGDTKALDEIFAKEFPNKAAVIKSMHDRAANTTFTSYSSDAYTYQWLDPNTVVMRHRAYGMGQENGRDFADQHQSLHVWVKRNGQWQVISTMTSPFTAEAQIMDSSRSIAKALVEKDWKTYDMVVGKTYIFTNPNAMVATKEQLMKRYASTDPQEAIVYNKLEYTDQNVQVYGNDTAIETGVANVEGKDGPNSITGKYRYTRMWVKQNDRWQAVATQSNRIGQQ